MLSLFYLSFIPGVEELEDGEPTHGDYQPTEPGEEGEPRSTQYNIENSRVV